MAGPEDKRTSWGGSPGDKVTRRRAKGYRATGKVPDGYKTQGKRDTTLGSSRILRWLFGDDGDK